MRDSFKWVFGAAMMAASGFASGMACAVIDAVQGTGDSDTPLVCATDKDDCNMDAADGCETDLKTSVVHCGICNNECQLDHATALCANGACEVDVCDPGWDNANNDDTDGCEFATS